MGYQPAKYKCAVNGVIKRFGMTGICGKIGCNNNLCYSKQECEHQLPVEQPKIPSNE